PPEPPGVSQVRDVVNRDHRGHTQPQRHRVRGREEYVEAIGGCDLRELHLLPPRAAGAPDQPRREPLIDPDRGWLRCIQHEIVPAGALVNRPLTEEPREVPAHTRGMATELTGIDADPHRVFQTTKCEHRNATTKSRRHEERTKNPLTWAFFVVSCLVAKDAATIKNAEARV